MRTAVLKANYVKKGSKGAAQRMRASADYYGQDKDQAGVYQGDLEGFTKNDDDLSRQEARAWLSEHYDPENEHGYRMVMSPGRAMGDDELREWARDNMAHLEAERGHEIDYLAYAHNDDEHPHVHVIFAEETTLRKHELNDLRREATERAQDWEQAREHTASLEVQQEFEAQDQEVLNQDFDIGTGGSFALSNPDDDLVLELDLDDY